MAELTRSRFSTNRRCARRWLRRRRVLATRLRPATSRRGVTTTPWTGSGAAGPALLLTASARSGGNSAAPKWPRAAQIRPHLARERGGAFTKYQRARVPLLTAWCSRIERDYLALPALATRRRRTPS